jgi:hypothetical protein
MQDFALGALSVLLVDGLSRKALLKEDAGLGTLLTLCGDGPDPESNACFEARRIMAAQTLASCVQRDPSVRLSLLQSGATILCWVDKPTLLVQVCIIQHGRVTH